MSYDWSLEGEEREGISQQRNDMSELAAAAKRTIFSGANFSAKREAFAAFPDCGVSSEKGSDFE